MINIDGKAYKSLYHYIVQKNHSCEKWKPANQYLNALRDLKSHFEEMESTMNKTEIYIRTNRTDLDDEFKKLQTKFNKKNKSFDDLIDYFTHYNDSITKRLYFR